VLKAETGKIRKTALSDLFVTVILVIRVWVLWGRGIVSVLDATVGTVGYVLSGP
jgi:hypothetical protein